MTSDDVLTAIYCVNKYAKKYAEAASDAYESGFKRQARINSIKKSALYDYKRHIISQLHDDGAFDEVDAHKIDSREFYCFYADGYSFHVPVDEIDVRVDSEPEDISDEFSSSVPASEELPFSERDALVRLQEQFGSANEFVGQRFVEGPISAESVGWKYLDEYVQEGDTVPEERVLEDELAEDFLLHVGDSFEVVDKGWAEVTDRYGAWKTGASHFSDIPRLRPVYDIQIDGDTREAVQQERILHDWRIRLRDTEDVAGVEWLSDSRWDEYLWSEVADLPVLFEGDKVVFEEECDRDAATVNRVELDGALVFFALDWEGEEWVDYLTGDEFLDDVVAVERGEERVPLEHQ